jgi:hypothetical protein
MDTRHGFEKTFGMAGLLLAFASGEAGCHAASVCSPTGASSGQIVREQNSAAYQTQVVAAQDGGAPAHVACRAEATIPTSISVVGDPERVNPMDPAATAKQPRGGGGTPAVDPRLVSKSTTKDTVTGEYRVLGVGRGIDHDDCGQTALAACNGAVDAYFLRAGQVRTLGVICQLSDNQEYCPAAGK